MTIKAKKFKTPTQFIILLVVITITGLLLSYKLLEIPRGLTIDEASLGYNAILLAQTGHDETGRQLPIFTLTINGTDWKQPITQYYLTALFKTFHPSIFLLRFSSVIIAIISTIIIYITTLQLFKAPKIAIFSIVIFLTSPLVVLHSHLATENIMPALFTSLWLLFIIIYSKKPKPILLIASALSLGLGFYSYKGMRAIVPIWTLISIPYIYTTTKINQNKRSLSPLKAIAVFIIFLLPFFIIIPTLEKHYAGAIFDSQNHQHPQSLVQFFYPYLSTFDPSFLYIKGDTLLEHSTHRHGMFLATTLPLFLYSIYKIIKQKTATGIFLITAFFSTPLLYGWVGSTYRASRLLALTPIYSLIIAIGYAHYLKQNHLKSAIKQSILVVFLIFFTWNLTSFLTYYWNDYPKLLENKLSGLEQRYSIQTLAQEAKKRKLRPYISGPLYQANTQTFQLFELIYFKQPINKLPDNQTLPADSILISPREQIDGLNRLNTNMPQYYLYINR